ncbi:MAG: heparinase II/III family protein, partial [Bacteroidia bacterium]
QVRYSLPDYEQFKNSMVKNVALVDDQLQGKKYKGNKGGSGFGKFGLLPTPTTIAWETNENFDLFVGSHDGFEASGVNYTRQVIYVKDEFWIVKDNFTSDATHAYKQVWQGHYTPEGTPDLLRSSFSDAKGSNIYQLNSVDTAISDGVHGKKWNVVSKADQKDFEFITVIRPYDRYNSGIDPTKNKIGDWRQNELSFDAKGYNLKSLSKGNEAYLFGVSAMKIETTEIQFNSPLDCYMTTVDNEIEIYSLSIETNTIKINNNTRNLLPGERQSIEIK